MEKKVCYKEGEFSKINTTLEFNAKFQEEMKMDIKEIKDSMATKEDLKNIVELLKGLDNKYASKNVEKIVYGMVALIMTIVITALIYSIIHGKGI